MSDTDEYQAPAAPRPVAGDDDGRAALLLIESLIHGLVGRSILSTEDAIEITETANDVMLELNDEWKTDPAACEQSRRAILAILNSLKLDARP